MDTKKRRKLGNIALLILSLAAVMFFSIAIKMYLAKVDERVNEILEKTDTTFIKKDLKESSSGLLVAKVKDDILKFLEGREVSTITYEIEGEPFYIELELEKNEVGEQSLTITKIVDESKGISASMNMKKFESVEFRTDDQNYSTLLKIETEYAIDYLAMIEGTYYFLGADIESISYMGNQFYYMSYNQDYLYLDEVRSCSKEVMNQIDGFNMYDYFYKYGKINFLEDFYQKLPSKTFTVAEKCKEFETE